MRSPCEIAHDLQHLLQGELNVLGRQVFLLGGDDLDEFRLRHSSPGAAQRWNQSCSVPICSFSRSPRLVPAEAWSER